MTSCWLRMMVVDVLSKCCLNFDGVGIQGTSTALATYPHPMSVVSVAFSKGNKTVLSSLPVVILEVSLSLNCQVAKFPTVLRNSEPHTPERGHCPVLQFDEEGALYFTDRKSRAKCGSWIAVVFQYMLVKANKEQRMAVHYLLNFHSHMEFAVRVEHSTSLMHLQDMQKPAYRISRLISKDAFLMFKTAAGNSQSHQWTRGLQYPARPSNRCELMLNSITQLLTALEVLNPDAADAINLQSLLTLVVESLHATNQESNTQHLVY
ncbi:hypothetical protein OS493_035956 [Desmophyllum pertusum]|uniref:Uncharacterized protein n=1 Tax=Desmophyllum pertusum TaxID=174260 RepID=A0A9X0CHX2_9CNID|nr:hypothetical protein OS493_035956 [Desmophyllum pertusum]